jgi:hypothetical protein
MVSELGNRCTPSSNPDTHAEQCQPPDNAKDYATYLNVNGSICLNFQC